MKSNLCFAGALLGDGNSAFSELVLEATREGLHVSLTAGTVGSAALSLGSPFKSAHASERVAARSANGLLDVERTLAASHTESVGLAGSFTERGGTFSHLV